MDTQSKILSIIPSLFPTTARSPPPITFWGQCGSFAINKLCNCG